MTVGSGNRFDRGAESPRTRRSSLAFLVVLGCLLAAGPVAAAAATAGGGPGGPTADVGPDASTAGANAGPNASAADVTSALAEPKDAASAAAADESVEVRYDVDLRPDDPDAMEVEITVTIPDDADVERLGFYPYGEEWTVEYEVLETDGIAERPGSVALWADTSRSESAVTFEFDPTVTRSNGYDHVVTDEWAFVRLRTDYEGAAPLAETVEPEGVKGLEYLYVGEHETYERDAYGQRLRLVVPDDAELAEEPADVLDSLVSGSRHLRVGERHEELNAFVAPAPPIRTGGAAPWTNRDFWVSDGSTLYSNGWAHEYVHTRQNYGSDAAVRTDGSEWRIEAEARYYQHLLAYEGGHLDGSGGPDAAFETFRGHLEIDREAHEGVELAAPDTWGSSSNYEKGALVVAALDAEIRERTGGGSTYQDVLWRLNEDGGGHDELADAIEAVVGERLDGFLERYVTGTEIPDVPDDPSLYERGEHGFDVSYDLAVAFAPDDAEAIAPGETGTLSYTLTNEGSDPGVAPEGSVDLPDGWTVESVEVSASDSSAWTTASETVSTAEFAPGETVEVRVTVRAPADASGTEPFAVTVDDADGYAASDTVAVTGAGSPEAELAVDGAVAIEGETVTLDAGDSEAEAGIASYEWDLTGDGEVDAETDEATLERAFEPGTRDVTVTVVDGNGLEDAATVSLTIADVPTVETAAERLVEPGESTTLEATVANDVGEAAVTWELPDGTELEGETVEHAFEVGVHDLRVRAVDEYGAESTATATIVANDDPRIEVAAPDPVTAGETATFEATVANEVGEATVTWVLPDDSALEGEIVEAALDPGQHIVEITVEDEYGGLAEATATITVAEAPDDEESPEDDASTADDGQPGFGATPALVVLLALTATLLRRR